MLIKNQLPAFVSTRPFHSPQTIEMGDHLVEVHDVTIFVMHVEEVHLVRERAAVKTAFLDEYDMITMRIGIDRAGSYTARRAFAANNHNLDAELREMRRQRGSIECAGALLRDNDVANLWREFRPDCIVRGFD